MSRFELTQSINLGLSAAQTESLGKIQPCSVRVGLFGDQKDFTLSAVSVVSIALGSQGGSVGFELCVM